LVKQDDMKKTILTKAFYADRTLCRQFYGLYDRMSKVKMSEMSFPPLNRIL
jgi:hypothetical protein